MRSTTWAGWIGRFWGLVLLWAAVVFAVVYTFVPQVDRFFGPLQRDGWRHPVILLLDATGLMIVAAASVVFAGFHKRRQGEERSRQAIGAMRDAVIVADARDRIIEWNPAAERLFQRPRTDVLGKALRQLSGSSAGLADLDGVFGSDDRAAGRMTDDLPTSAVIHGQGADPVEIEVVKSNSPGRGPGGTVYVFRDVTRRETRRSEPWESDLQPQLATEIAEIAIWRCDLGTGQMIRSRNHDALYGLPGRRQRNLATFLEATHPGDRERCAAVIHAAAEPGGPDVFSFEFRVTIPDETVRWLWVKGRVTQRGDDRRGITARGVLLDVTDRKNIEAKLERMTRLYAALSQCNQAIVRSSSEQELFPMICRDAVNFGGFKMASISMIVEGSESVTNVAAFGAGVEYMEGIEIAISEDTPAGRGPTGTCIRENRAYWCQDYQRDPATAPWHERGVQYGWCSSAALPLKRKGKVVGALSVYSDLLDAFDDDSKSLLREMAADVSFAMDRMVDERMHKLAVEALRRSDQRLRAIIENEPECVKVVDKDGFLLDMNRAGLAMLEIESVESARKHNLIDFVLPQHQESFRNLHRRVMNGENGMLEFEVRGLKGTRRWLETHAAPMVDSNGAVESLLGVTRDITERRSAEQRIQYLANFDALTGLPNRNLLTDHVEYAISLANHNNAQLCVMFVDLDRFKDINDTLGHNAGDSLLIEVGKRLRAALYATDTVSRLGGDEFVVVLPDSGAHAAAHVAAKVLAAISMPCRISHYELAVTASIGIAVYPNDGKDIDALFRSADSAMYLVKHEGRNGYRFYTEEMQARAVRHMGLSNAMRRALELGEFELHYQPQFSFASGEIVGVEALLRWRNRDFGSVTPAEFIPVAEYSGLILPIGAWVLRAAAAQLKECIDAGSRPIVMAVNISTIQFRDQNLSNIVRSVLADMKLPDECLELELTETVAMGDPQGAIAIMEGLRRLGVRMAIDDFGTGYSSLNYLKRFRLDKLKIDQSFISGIASSPEDRAIVKAIVSLSRNLGLRTVAEGVETAEQVAFLREQGCDEAQGYYFCKPLPGGELVQYLRGHRQLGAADIDGAEQGYV